MSLETMTKLSTVTVGAGGSSTVSFTNIPQGYTDLKFIFSAQGTYASAAFDGVYLSFNGSTDNFTGKYTQAITPSTPTSGSLGRYVGAFPTTTLTSKFGSAELYISGYSSNKYKMYTADAVTGGYSSNQALLEFINATWSNPAPVTSVSFAFLSGNFAQYSTVTMYGIKDAAKTAGNSIKATGGNIVFDGTYVYHVFNASGTFTPTTALRADYLVVAGGGCATNSRGGGGGAGGLRSTVGSTGGGGSLETPLSLSPSTYAVTVGAGGAYNAGAPVNGSDSGIGGPGITAIVSTGGGGGGGSGAGTAGSGGSGGGAGTNSLTAGTGISGQGYAGGAGSSNYYGGGGGGGAGQAGQSIPVGSTNNGGYGGAGVLISALATATGSGVNGYFAGGGGGGYFSASAGGGSAGTVGGVGGAGGGGNAAQGAGQTGTAGTPNTGGGGGSGIGNPGGTGDTAGASGGSGIVIIRYKG